MLYIYTSENIDHNTYVRMHFITRQKTEFHVSCRNSPEATLATLMKIFVLFVSLVNKEQLYLHAF